MKRAAFVAVVAAGALLLAAPALAHVSVRPQEAKAGEAASLTFRVPNERENVATVAIEINLPPELGQPVQAVPKPGWTHTVEAAKVTWTGGRIAPDQRDDFQLTTGPLPQGVEQLVFKVLQTYEGGEVVHWIDLSQPGAEPPDHPAPVLRVTGAGDATITTTTAPGVVVNPPIVDYPAEDEGLPLLAIALGVLGVGFVVTIIFVAARRGSTSR